MIDILLAVILDFLIGDPLWFPHPVIYIGKLISFLEKKGRKRFKSEKSLKIWGLIIVLIVGSSSYLIPYVILRVFVKIPILYHSINVILLWTTLAAKSLHREGIKVYYSLKSMPIEDSREKLSYIVGRETKDLTHDEIVRADVETIAENTSDGVIAPLLFMMIGGAPLAFLYKGINTIDSMLGYLTPIYKSIGYFGAKTDDVFNLIPARITGVLMCLVSPIVKGNIIRSFKIMIRDRKNHKSPNCGYPEAALAGALNIRIGGTNTYFGEVIEKPTIGDSGEVLSEEHILKTIILMYGSEILFLIIYILMVVAYGI